MSVPWWRRPVVLVLALAAVLALVLALVRPGGGAPQPTGGAARTLAPLPSVDATPDPAQAMYAGQRLDWGPCPSPAPTRDGSDDAAVRCARLAVPVDWADPGGARIELALARRSAPAATRSGVLVVDPGGPGSSGVDWVRSGSPVSADAGARLDVVGFDPRGSGASAPVVCLDDAAMDAYLAGQGGRAAAGGDAGDPAPGSGGSGAAGDDDGSGALARGCAERGGPLLGHVDVASSARDLEVLRDALGQEHLDYLGKSWGTLLGATYAGLFPQRVGRVVLDGALDPALSARATALDQARGLEGALRAWAADCPRRSSCPVDVSAGPDGGAARADEAAASVGTVLDAARERPLPASDGRVLTEPLALTAVIAPLYDQRSWPVLDAGLAAATKGDGAALLGSADAYVGRRSDGTYRSNLIQAFTATTCLDTDTSRDPAPQASAGPGDGWDDPDSPAEPALVRAAPVLGPHLASDASACALWPVAGVRSPAPITAEGAAPILVVGTTNDPATPYRWARSLAKQLSSSGLLTYEGQGHTAYGRGSACIDAAVDGYLLDGAMPGEGATCGT